MDAREETALSALGPVGPWQIKISLLMAFLKFPVAWTLLGMIFMGAHVDHHCVGSTKQCETETGEACTKWEYNRTVFKETIATEWDLVCSRSQLVNFAQMSFMIGIMFGTILFSIASDRWGRKKPLIMAGILQLLTGVATAFVPWYWGFIALRFIQALTVGGCMTISFVLCMEVLSGPWRTIMSTLTHIPFNLGTIMMAGLAWLTRDWRTFQLAISLPIVLIFIYPWLIPESPRWLLAVGRDREALKILQEAAARNGRPIPEKIPEMKKKSEDGAEVHKPGVLDLLRTPNMRKKTLVAWFSWINVGLCFFGLEQYLSQVGGNIFINVAMSGVCIIPGVLASILTMDKLGRRWTLCAGQFTAALCCLIIILLPKDAEWWRVSFATIGVTATAIAFTTLYLYSTELFPTVVRNTGLGAGSMCARIGSMVAPFVASLDKLLWHNAPAVMFGCSSCMAGLLCFLLPETLGTLLPTTLEEGEAFTGKTSKDEDGKENKGYVEDIPMET